MRNPPNFKRSTTFYCFSPPVMLATLAVEFMLFLFVLVKYKMSPLVKVSGAILLLLATFQTAEYFICTGQTVSGTFWFQVGFMAISLLPPLGVHLACILLGKQPGFLVQGSYALGISWAVVFGLSDFAFTGYACTGNYVIFQLQKNVAFLYSLYYYGVMFIGIWLTYQTPRKMSGEKEQTLRFLRLGYLAFMIPTAIAVTIQPSAISGIPSIMCGFAIIFAILIGYKVVPLAGEIKESQSQLTPRL